MSDKPLRVGIDPLPNYVESHRPYSRFIDIHLNGRPAVGMWIWVDQAQGVGYRVTDEIDFDENGEEIRLGERVEGDFRVVWKPGYRYC